MNYFTKYIKVETIVNVTTKNISKFLYKLIIHKFGILKVVVIDNNTQFINYHFKLKPIVQHSLNILNYPYSTTWETPFLAYRRGYNHHSSQGRSFKKQWSSRGQYNVTTKMSFINPSRLGYKCKGQQAIKILGPITLYRVINKTRTCTYNLETLI
ncbi:hypothetical protein CR513_41385, partial [Mucuna pruriens]